MKTRMLGAALFATAVAGCNATEDADNGAEQALMDRIAIEDMVVEYYSHLGGDDAGAFEDYFTEDAVFDVNGIVANGREEIEAIYAGLGDDESSAGNTEGVFRMILSNPVIEVDGDTATASFIWTGISNPGISEPPVFVEQGREFDRLVRVDGEWKFSHRVVIADSGLPDSMLEGYEPRMEFGVDDLNP